MHFAIGTTNIPKSSAISQVLALYPPTKIATFSNHRVASGVPDMPKTLEQIRTGAKCRAVFTRREKPDADYFVGMEGGVYSDYEGGEYWLVGVVYIEDREGKGYYGYSSHLEVPESIMDNLLDGSGRDLEQVIHSLYSVQNVGDDEGSFGLFSDGTIPRSDAFIQATKAALVPHFSKYYR